MLDRLRAFEIKAGYTDEDLLEARNAGRMAPRQGLDSLPPLYRVPNTKPKPKLVREQPEDPEAQRLASLLPRVQLDPLYCPDQLGGCKFLLAAWIGEQETKAQMHLYQLGLLARSLGRILVLPNVARSRMQTCAKQPFDYYYAEDGLDKLGIPSMSLAKMIEWSGKRSLKPTAQIVSIVNAKAKGPAEALELDLSVDGMTVPTSPKRKLCLQQPRSNLDFSHFSPMTAYAPTGFHRDADIRGAFGESLINTLSSEEALGKAWRGDLAQRKAYLPLEDIDMQKSPSPDVLVVNYELRFPMLSIEKVQKRLDEEDDTHLMELLPFSHFAYSSIWTSLGKQLAESLSPFVAIHWRQETLPSSVIAPCGEALVDRLADLLREQYPSIKTVYLATDYPIDDLRNGRDGVAARSGTFGRALTEEHHSAMSNFLQIFQTRLTDMHGIRLATLEGEQDKVQLFSESPKEDEAEYDTLRPSKVDFAEMDAGIVGIIDKTVAMHAQVFLTGESWSGTTAGSACGKYSSFTRQISEARAQRRAQDGTTTSLWSK